MFIVELSYNHATLFKTYIDIFSHIGTVYGFMSAYRWKTMFSEDDRRYYGKNLFLWGKEIYESRKGKLLDIVRQKMFFRSFLNSVFYPKKGDIFVFPTLDSHINPHIEILLPYMLFLKTKGVTVIGALHNTDFHGARGYAYQFSRSDFKYLDNYLRWLYWYSWMHAGKRQWSSLIDVMLTCGNIVIPSDISKRVIIPTRFPTWVEDWIDKPFSVAITGGMSDSRIDWSVVFDVVKELSSIRFYFLGKMPEEKARMLQRFDNVVYFTSHIPEDEFVSLLRRVHAVWAPLSNHRYGIYTISGSIGADAIAFAIPAIVPSFYASAPEDIVFSRFDASHEAVSNILALKKKFDTGEYIRYRKMVYAKLRRKYNSKRLARNIAEVIGSG